jgi:hypothetical protein
LHVNNRDEAVRKNAANIRVGLEFFEFEHTWFLRKRCERCRAQLTVAPIAQFASGIRVNSCLGPCRFSTWKTSRIDIAHPGSAQYSILIPVPMVRQTHHERNFPFNRCASFNTCNCEATTRPQLALPYWNHRRYDKR